MTPSPITGINGLVSYQLNGDINQFGGYTITAPYSWNPATSVGTSITGVTSIPSTSPSFPPPYSAQSEAQVTTSTAHGLSPGKIVVIAGVGGMSGVNGTWMVDEIRSATVFTIITSVSGTYTPNTGTVSIPTPLNQNTYQIISAGQDGVFGAGGYWNPGVGYPPGSPPNVGADDLANFSKAVLGKPQN
jgi:hypothetical protein